MVTAQGRLLAETITLNLQDLKFKKTRFRVGGSNLGPSFRRTALRGLAYQYREPAMHQYIPQGHGVI